MKSYANYQEKISDLKDVSATVKTIEKIAATKVVFLKKKSADLTFYINNLENILFRLLDFYSTINNFLLQKKTKGKKILLVVTSDKSLVGGLWHKITDEVLKISTNYDMIYTFGNKGKRFLEEDGIKITKNFTFLDILSTNDGVFKVSNSLLQEFKNPVVQKIDVIYENFENISEQKIVKTHFLPFDFQQEKTSNIVVGLPIFEQNKRKIFDAFLEKYIHNFFYSIILQASLSEFSAKTLEMEYASEKSKELAINIQKKFIKERREITTQRQLEIFNCKK